MMPRPRTLIVCLALIGSLLPAGACVAAGWSPEGGQPTACCLHPAVPAPSAPAGLLPTQPTAPLEADCCCRQAQVAPEGATAPDDSAPALVAWLADPTPLAGELDQHRRPTSAEHFSGPPMRILLCVWRC